MLNSIFIDTSALIALYIKEDEFHKAAIKTIAFLKEKQDKFITSNFILDEMYTFLRTRKGKQSAVLFADFLAENSDLVQIIRVTVGDEKKAFQYFKRINGRGVSFTDCASFALMKRLNLKTAFTFDKDFGKAGFKIIP